MKPGPDSGPEFTLLHRQAADGDLLFDDPEIRVAETIRVTRSDADFLRALGDRVFKPFDGMPISLPLIGWGQEQIATDGAIRDGFCVPLELYPPTLQEAAVSARERLLRAANRFVRLICWRQSASSEWTPIDSASLYWGLKGNELQFVKERAKEQSFTSPPGITWSDSDRDDILALWADGSSEPLGHELLREARQLAGASSRSSLLVAASALEVGVKRYLAARLPGTDWLMENVPSPPVDKMLRQFVPLVTSCSPETLKNWPNLGSRFKIVTHYIEQRNKIAHQGNPTIELRLRDFIAVVEDFLFIFDVLSGHEWAKQNVSAETQKLLGWSADSRPYRYSGCVLANWPPPELQGGR